RWQNYLGRFNYNYNSKLFLEFLFRYQGSSIFYQNNRWGFFPGGSIAYRVSEENFWKENIRFINNFKLRASYGKTGNDLVPPFQYLSLYQQGITSYVEQVGSTGSLTEISTLRESVAAYKNATWEKADQLDIGLDADMFDSKVSLTFDYFKNKRTDILTPLSGGLPASTGIIPPDQNLGKFLNRGFDFNIAYENKAHAFTYGISLNGLYAKNKYLYFDEVAGIPGYQQQTGHPIGAGLYYNVLGIFRTAADLKKYPAQVNGQAPQLGDLIFQDVNHDGKIDQLDLVRSYKSSVPVFSGGLNFNFGYKNFDLSVLFQGALGAAMYLRPNFSLNTNYLVSFYEKRWTPENINASFPRFSSGASTYWTDPAGVFNTFFLHNTD
ncbi:MAG TPA: SusC/RagA family TonB-linked outer membrane protein, partial [Chitinophagaceae bacterium]